MSRAILIAVGGWVTAPFLAVAALAYRQRANRRRAHIRAARLAHTREARAHAAHRALAAHQLAVTHGYCTPDCPAALDLQWSLPAAVRPHEHPAGTRRHQQATPRAGGAQRGTEGDGATA